MPFIEAQHRDSPDLHVPGHRCFVEYRWMIRKWRESPRWTTADYIYESYLLMREAARDHGRKRALDLAWQVFFQLQVVPYEVKKRKENGEVL